jgi:hypothetical protein
LLDATMTVIENQGSRKDAVVMAATGSSYHLLDGQMMLTSCRASFE